MNTRIQKIVDAVKKNGHDGIVISKGSDIKSVSYTHLTLPTN